MQHVPRNRSDKDQMTYTNSQIASLIDEYIHSERDRRILKRRFIDGIGYERLAEEMDMSVSQIKRVVYKSGDKVFLNLK